MIIEYCIEYVGQCEQCEGYRRKITYHFPTGSYNIVVINTGNNRELCITPYK